MTSGRAFVCMDQLLHGSRSSPMYLQIPDIAALVTDSIHAEDGDGFDLHAWVVMPNHVHLLFTPWADLATVMRRIKGATAREANRRLGLTGMPFWQGENYDHLVRDNSEFGRIERYIVQNPVQAGIVRAADEYPWSNASVRSG